MPVEILYAKKAFQGREKLSARERAILEALEEDLRATGGKPFGRGWQSLGPLRQCGDDIWHCHLTRNKVAVWRILPNGDVALCRFEYVGERGNAPY